MSTPKAADAMAADIHSCGYYCDRPGCIKAQRDDLRDRLATPTPDLARLRAKVEAMSFGETGFETAAPIKHWLDRAEVLRAIDEIGGES